MQVENKRFPVPHTSLLPSFLGSAVCLGSGCAPAPGVWKQQKPGRFGSSSCTQTFCPLSTHVSSAWGLEPGPKRSRRLARRVLAVFLPRPALDVPVGRGLRDCSSLRAARGLSVHQSAQSWWRALPAAPRPFLLEFWGLFAGSPRCTSEGEMAESPQHEVVPAANPQPANCLQTFLLRGCSLVARREQQPPSRGPAPPLALGRGGFLNPNNGCDQRANNTPASDGAQLNTNLIRVPI